MHPMGFPIHEASLISKFLSINLLYRYLATSSPLIFHRRWKLWSTKKKHTHRPDFPMSHPGWFLLQGSPKFISWFVWVAIPTGGFSIPVRSSEKKIIPPPKKTTKNQHQLSLDPATFEVPCIPFNRFKHSSKGISHLAKYSLQTDRWDSIPPFHLIGLKGLVLSH